MWMDSDFQLHFWRQVVLRFCTIHNIHETTPVSCYYPLNPWYQCLIGVVFWIHLLEKSTLFQRQETLKMMSINIENINILNFVSTLFSLLLMFVPRLAEISHFKSFKFILNCMLYHFLFISFHTKNTLYEVWVVLRRNWKREVYKRTATFIIMLFEPDIRTSFSFLFD